MDSRVDWIGVAVLVGVGLIVPIQAEEGVAGRCDVASREQRLCRAQRL